MNEGNMMSVQSSRLRVALLADDFNPEWPSLPIVGFNYGKALAEHAEVTVFTQVRNKDNLAKLGALKFSVEYIDNEHIASPMHKLALWLRGGNELGWTIQIASKYLPYIQFERLVLRHIRVNKLDFDIVHRITPMSPTLPSFASGRVIAPFVIGPLNGNLPWPDEFLLEQRREHDLLNAIKGIYKILPFQRSTYRDAAAILAAFPHTISSLNKSYRAKTFDFPEVGYDPEIFYSSPRERTGRITFLYAGRLVPYKLPEFAVLAFAMRPELQKHRLLFVGDGPERARLERLSATHGLQSCVEFAGRLSQREVAGAMRGADVLFFPSIRELGAGVVVEALACGLPCLVADYGAPGALIDDNRGRKVPLGGREKMVAGFAAAAVELASNPARLARMSDQSAEYAARTFSWERKAIATISIYKWILGRSGQRPEFTY